MAFRQPDKETKLFEVRIGNSTNYLVAKRLDFGNEPKYDIREYYTKETGEIAPGTKGIRVSSVNAVDLLAAIYNGMDSAEQQDFLNATGLEEYDGKSGDMD